MYDWYYNHLNERSYREWAHLHYGYIDLLVMEIQTEYVYADMDWTPQL